MARSIRRIASHRAHTVANRADSLLSAMDAIYRGLTRLESLAITPTESNIAKEMINRYNAFTDLDTVDESMTVLADRETDQHDSLMRGLERNRESIMARRDVLASVGVHNIAESLARENHVPLRAMVDFLTKAADPADSKPYTFAEIAREIADGNIGLDEYDYSSGCEDAPLLRRILQAYFSDGRDVSTLTQWFLVDRDITVERADSVANYIHANWNDMLAALARAEWNEVKPDVYTGVKSRIPVIKAVRSLGYGDLQASKKFLDGLGLYKV